VEWWSTGVVEYWSGGVLEYWSIGVLEYWSTGSGEVDEIKWSSRLALRITDSKIQLDQTFTR
jgi:hypothetical protein